MADDPVDLRSERLHGDYPLVSDCVTADRVGGRTRLPFQSNLRVRVFDRVAPRAVGDTRDERLFVELWGHGCLGAIEIDFEFRYPGLVLL